MERPSAPASTRIRNSAAASPPRSPRKPAFRSSKPLNHFEANAQRDGLVECHGNLRTIATTLFNVSNNHPLAIVGPALWVLRNQASRPAAGQLNHAGQGQSGDVRKHDAGCALVMGNDQAVAISGATGGQFQLNIMMPVMGTATIESIRLLSAATRAFVDFCAVEMEANADGCEGGGRKKPVDGHEPESAHRLRKAAALAKEAFRSGKTIRQLCQEQNILPEAELNKALDPWSMTEPHE